MDDRTGRFVLKAAGLTALFLFGGMLVGLLLGFAINGLPMHMPEAIRVVLSSLPAMAAIFGGGLLWGRAMARLSASDEHLRAGLAGSLGFGLSIILAAIGLSGLEVAIVQLGGGPELPIHILFTLLFVPSTFLVAGLGSLAIGWALRGWRFGVRTGPAAGLSAGLAFLAVNLLMDSLGWRVGAPGAAERATMLTVMMLGSLGAALAGGAIIGALLRREAAAAV